MKHIIVLFLALLSFSFTYAQSDPKAEKLVNEVLQKVKGYENINVKFSYNLENKAKKRVVKCTSVVKNTD